MNLKKIRLINNEYVWKCLKVTSYFNIPGIIPTWNASTLSSRWGQVVWMIFLALRWLLWPRTATKPLFKYYSGKMGVLKTKQKIYLSCEYSPTLTDLCHISNYHMFPAFYHIYLILPQLNRLFTSHNITGITKLIIWINNWFLSVRTNQSYH